MAEPKRVERHGGGDAGFRALIEEVVRAKGAGPVESLDDLKTYSVDIWESDEEFEEFLADVRATRNADLG